MNVPGIWRDVVSSDNPRNCRGRELVVQLSCGHLVTHDRFKVLPRRKPCPLCVVAVTAPCVSSSALNHG